MKEEVKEHFSWEDEEKEEETDELFEEPEEKVKEEKKVKKKKKARKRSKKKNIKKYIWSVVILIIAVSLFVVYKDNIFPKKETVKTVAIVNNELLTSEQLDNYYTLSVPEQMKGILSKEFFLEESVIPEMLLIQEAEKEGINAEDEEVEFYINNLIARAGLTKEEFILALEKDGFDIYDVEEIQRKRIIISKLIENKINSNIAITEKELKGYYNENKEEYSPKQGQIRVSHILLETKEETESILEELKKGADFSKIALEISIDPSAKLNKGELGFIEKGQMVPEFEKAAFSLKVGELSEPVKSMYGYHIIKRGNDELSFEEAKDSINLSLFTAKQVSAIETYIKQLKSKAKIELYPEDVVVEELEKEVTFKTTGDEVCKKDGKPVIRMFSAEIDYHSKWVTDSFNEVVKEYEGKIIAHNWQIDTGDDLLTEEIEEKIPRTEFDIYKKYNNKGTVPTFVFGCKYLRIGNGYEAEGDLFKEEAEFRELIEKLV